MFVIKRPAEPQGDLRVLEGEFQKARKAHHSLLEFEDEHQAILDRVSKEIDPGYIRLARLVGKLRRRFRGHQEDIRFASIYGALNRRLEEQREPHRERRNSDPRWKEALAWADEPVGALKRLRKSTKLRERGKNETLEDYSLFVAKVTATREMKFGLGNHAHRTRREQRHVELYNEMCVRSDTWNDLRKRIESARKAVLKCRREGRQSSWKHPKWFEGHTLVFKGKSCDFEILKRPIEVNGSVNTLRLLLVRTKVERSQSNGGVRGSEITFEVGLADTRDFDLCDITEVRLSRSKKTRMDKSWQHSVAIVLNAQKDISHVSPVGWCGIDSGHREHGHEGSANGIRVAYWYGSDGDSGQVLLPVRPLLDRAHALQADLDLRFNVRLETLGPLFRFDERRGAQVAVGSRYQYQRYLASLGVRTREQADWTSYEHLTEKQIAKARRRVESIRRDVFSKTARELSKRYSALGLEKLKGHQMRALDTASESPLRKRQNRDVSAAYLFKEICERSGARVLEVSARGTSQVCPKCAQPTGKLEGLNLVCPNCGLTYDRDFGAAKEICRRTGEALAKLGVTSE